MPKQDILDFCYRLGVSRETYRKLEIYQKLLVHWQKKTNLVAPSTVEEFWHRHVEDSLQCVKIKADSHGWVDIGSGAGFPGLVVAMALFDKSDFKMTLVDSNYKKCAFLRTVARETGLVVDVIPKRIEAYVSVTKAPEVVSARAVSSLTNLLKMCQPWLTGGTIALFHKGRDYQAELKESHDKWRYNLIEHRSEVSKGSVVLEISKLLHL